MDDSELEAQVSKMSSHELLINPETLVGGLLQSVQGIRKLGANVSDAAPPPTSGKPGRRRGRKKLEKAEPKDLLKQKMKSEKESKLRTETEVTETENNNVSDDVEDDLLSVGTSGSNDDELSAFGSEESATSGSEADEDVQQKELQRKRGEAQFGELNKRFNNLVRDRKKRSRTTAKDIDKEFDLDASEEQLMPLLFPDYEKKEKLFEEHKQKIEALTEETVVSYFKDVQDQLLGIYEGRLSTTRSTLYLSKDTTGRDNAILKSLEVSYPFSNKIYLQVDESMWNLLEIKPKKRKLYREFVTQIMIPEALVRIYALVNNVSLEHAELEMKCGPQYDGPLPGKPALRVRDPHKKESHYRYGKDFAM